MGLSWQHILLLMIVALLLFGGRGKISGLMGDFASGIKAFKKGLAEDDSEKVAQSEPSKSIDHQATQSGGATAEPAKKMDQPAQPAA